METSEVNESNDDNYQGVYEHVTSEKKEISGSDFERSLESSGFQRGVKNTKSLDRLFKRKEFGRFNPQSALQRTESVASNFPVSEKSSGFFEKIFSSKSKRDKLKDEISHLQTEIACSKTQALTDKAKLEHLQKEIVKLENENIRLKEKNNLSEDRIIKLYEDNENLKKNNEDLQAYEKRMITSVSQMLKSYGEKISFLDHEILQHVGDIKNVDNLQIGSKNIQVQNISNVDIDGLDRLLSQYHDQLELVARELNQTMQNLQVTKIMQDQLNQRVLVLEDMQKEMTEALRDVKLSKNQEITTELDYTISLTDPRLMAECIDELQGLPRKTENYTFKDLAGNAKVGVLRVYKKYVKRMKLKRFVQRLEMEDIIGEEMTTDTPLQKDDCAWLLVKWVQMRKENDADALLERFPLIQPGTDTRRGKMYTYNAISTDSVSSNDDLVYRAEYLKEGLIKEIKQTVQHEISVQITPKFEEIKNKLDKNEPRSLFV